MVFKLTNLLFLTAGACEPLAMAAPAEHPASPIIGPGFLGVGFVTIAICAGLSLLLRSGAEAIQSTAEAIQSTLGGSSMAAY